MTTSSQVEMSNTLLREIRKSFAQGDWDATAALYTRFAEIKTDRATSVEASCLAARALGAAGHKREARQLLKTVEARTYKKPAHYEFLARAHLDLKQYLPASEACKQAEELRVAEGNRPIVDKPT